MCSNLTCCYRANGACHTHEPAHYHCPNISYPPYPAYTAAFITTHNSDNRSPHVITITPRHTPSPLPSLSVFNLPASRRNSPGPVVPVQLSNALTVDPLVAIGSGPYYSKLHYDVAENPHTAYVSAHGIIAPLDEQRDRPVIEGALPDTSLHIVFNHPSVTKKIKCDASLTIEMLIELLHSYFLHVLGEKEKTELAANMELYAAAVTNQQKRCRAAFDPKLEWSQGMKRIDLLGKTRKFCGVTLDATSSNSHLTLHVEFEK
jgi:hypothetical protein